MKHLLRGLIIGILFLSVAVFAQTQKPTPEPAETPPDQDIEKLKIDTNLVTVPVIASSRTGTYIADLKKEEFKLSEDGVPQEIAFLASIDAPFHVVLMLDTSNSTEEKLPLIQHAAIAFLEQLAPKDQVKVISFDGELHDWNDFTSDKAALRNAISQTKTGNDTHVYDAVQLALNSLRSIQGRKAIVIFTDGVDWHSDTSSFNSTIKDLDESGVIVYPIRFDTRAETERLARQQDAAANGVGLPTGNGSIIRTPPLGTTPTTFPSDDPFPVPDQKRTTSTLPLPDPRVIFGRRNTIPPNSSPTDPFPNTDPRTNDPRDPRNRDPRDPNSNRMPMPDGRTTSRDDSISAMLNNLYFMADSYLKELADRSGGQVYRADTIALLPQAFAAIAAELRTQYMLGYYPSNKNPDGSYRKIQVKTSRKDIAVRARPGYRAKTQQ
ncbi:MAG TPA: VWA domain-containing protein [Pyrinomonadaceae bacterium]|nr:VWA domain-containing protein [Pyrinomonadaceae bacterium]